MWKRIITGTIAIIASFIFSWLGTVVTYASNYVDGMSSSSLISSLTPIPNASATTTVKASTDAGKGLDPIGANLGLTHK